MTKEGLPGPESLFPTGFIWEPVGLRFSSSGMLLRREAGLPVGNHRCRGPSPTPCRGEREGGKRQGDLGAAPPHPTKVQGAPA